MIRGTNIHGVHACGADRQGDAGTDGTAHGSHLTVARAKKKLRS